MHTLYIHNLNCIHTSVDAVDYARVRRCCIVAKDFTITSLAPTIFCLELLYLQLMLTLRKACLGIFVSAGSTGLTYLWPAIANTIAERFIKFSVQLYQYQGQSSHNFGHSALIGFVFVEAVAVTRKHVFFTKVSLSRLLLVLEVCNVQSTFTYAKCKCSELCPSQDNIIIIYKKK